VPIKNCKPLPETGAHFKFAIQFFPECMKIQLSQDCVKQELTRLVNDLEVKITSENRIINAVAYVCLVAHENPKSNHYDILDKKFNSIFPKHTDPLCAALSFIEKSPMYGVNYFEIKNKKKVNLLLGVDCFGLSIYRPNNRVEPISAFSWSELNKVSYVDTKFAITFIKEKSKEFIFEAKSTRVCDEMIKIIMGNHKRFMQRAEESKCAAEIKEAEKALGEIFVHEKKRLETQKESQMKYETTVDEMIKSGVIDDEKTQKCIKFEIHLVEESFSKIKGEMEKQIKEAHMMAEEERALKLKAEQELKKLTQVAEEMKSKISAEEEDKQKMMFLEAQRSREEERKRLEIERLNKTVKEFELKHQEDLKRMAELQKRPPTLPHETVLPISNSSISFEEAKKNKNDEILKNIKKVGTLMNSRCTKADVVSEQVEKFAQEGNSRFKTLQMLRKNNTRARIDEFESL
ncbi:hypothetical protein MXB_4431, partial [Myxobolus squamalis]